ncbi:hypothetical protein CMUS01_01661 [Colletotrichum musicola]|uniref:Uncharacterized protein n=1 Tax=Colletotrichum musicola TaxID=2175873 RepID=A0A8H6NWL1_9PEZI|nr:hypothetical protein CMUS01_01661 [Colletotrichum musicola]
MPTIANPLPNFGIFYRRFTTGTKRSPSCFIGVGMLATARPAKETSPARNRRTPQGHPQEAERPLPRNAQKAPRHQ